jgi:hypothetical protein
MQRLRARGAGAQRLRISAEQERVARVASLSHPWPAPLRRERVMEERTRVLERLAEQLAASIGEVRQICAGGENERKLGYILALLMTVQDDVEELRRRRARLALVPPLAAGG